MLLDRYGLAAHKRHGQNFVVDPNTVRKVVRQAGVRPGDHVCEIGPGLGSLTLALLSAGARVLAIEVDAGLVRALREVLAEATDVRIVHADALQVSYAELVEDQSLLVANLPYNLATPLVITALRSGRFRRALVMVQREVGERWAAQTSDAAYGAVSVKLAALAAVRMVGSVSRQAFYPVPNVDSVTVELVPHPDTPDQTAFFALVTAGFAQRRKRLRNALTAAGYDPSAVSRALRQTGFDDDIRAEQLSLPAWRALDAALSDA